MYLGDYAEDYATLNFCFSTHKADGTPIALAGTPALSVYKGSNTTQSTAGITLDVDYDGVTGLNHVLIDLSADAFYAVANDYSVVITTGTVNGISVVGQVVREFSIENRSRKADLVSILGTALTETAGLIAAAFKKFFNVAAPTGTVNSLADAVPGAAGGGLIAGSNAATTFAGVTSTAGITVTQSAGNGSGIDVTGNGTGAGMKLTGGATGPGFLATGGGNHADADGMRAVAGGALASDFDADIGGSVTVSGEVTLAASQPSYDPIATINAKVLKYVQLLARKDAAIATDNATELTAINANGGSGVGAFNNTTDSEEAIADADVTINTNVLALATALSPVSQAAGSSTDTTGTVISGTYANTDTADANLWVTAPVNPGGLDMRLNFALGANRIPISVAISGWFNGSSQYANVYAYDYLNAAWNQLSNSANRMATRTSTANYSYPLTLQNFDPATGNVIIRFVSPSTNTGHRLSLDRVVVNSIGGSTGSPAGLTAEQVWNYVTRTLTSDTGEPIDTAALAAAVAALILITPANKILTDTDGHVTADVTGTVTVGGNVTLAASQPNLASTGIATAANQTTILSRIGTPADTDLATDIANIDASATTIINNIQNITNIIEGGGTGAGDGSEVCTIYVLDDSNDPIADVDCTIRAVNDPDEDIVASGKSDAFGVIIPHPKLDPGSYYLWKQKVGEDFSNPYVIVVPES